MPNLDLQGLVLSLGAAFFFTAFFLYHFMVFRVNKLLPPEDRIPHSLDLGKGNRLAAQYKALYPRSILYHLTLVSAVSVFVLALAFAALRLRS